MMTFIPLAAPLAILLAAAGGWPQWRGPASSGVSGERGIPLPWSAEEILWKTAIPGRGHSSPIVWGGRVFLTTAVEGEVLEGAKAVKHFNKDGSVFDHPDAIGANRRQTLKVLALDAATGRILWERTAHDGAVYDNRHRKNTYATPTPAADGRAIYAWFGSEGLYAYDFSGKLLWKSSLGPLAAMGMGVASSPALYRGLVILQCDQDNGEKSFLAAVRSQDGREAWRVKRTALEGWATPVVARGRERDELIVSARELVAAHDPASGKELWRSEGTGVNPAPSPVAGHGLVYLTAGAGEKKALAVRLGGAGEIAWRYNRGTAHVASPLVYGDYLYLMMDNGALSCLDARTGEVKYAGARLPAPASFSASMVAVDGRILLASEEGEVYLVRAGPKWELLGARSLGEGVYASPAIAGGRLFIRGERTLFCIGKRK